MTPKPKTIWSPYQQAIFADVADPNGGNTVVIARAGSGKTKSLVEAINHIPNKKAKILCCAFNKSIAVELEERINKSYVDVRTLHSFGFSAIKTAFAKEGIKVAIDPAKAMTLIKSTFEPGYKCWEELFSLDKAVSLCKSNLVDTPKKVDALLDDYDITPVDLTRDEFVKRVVKVLALCRAKKDSVNFDDMIWFVPSYALPVPQYDFVFIDEGQDLSSSRAYVALSAISKTGRCFVLADDRQAIYGWAGADERSVPHLISKLNAKTLPLPLSYRCDKAIIKLAQSIVPDIQYCDTAGEGKVSYITEDQLVDKAKPGDFVISRTNAPLIKSCMQFIKNKIPANVYGRDIGANLKSLIKKSKKKDLKSFHKWLDGWRDEELARLREKNRSTDSVMDRYECLMMLSEDADSLSDIEKNIDTLFADKDGSNIVLHLSGHRSKGLEADNVFLLRKTFKPNVSEQEANVFYVAITRGRHSLTMVNKA
jgi:DNA helicase-2/ATP-dependent DNA helicase PcrA